MTGGPKTDTGDGVVTVGLEMPGKDALQQLATTEAKSFDDVFTRAVALKIRLHGGVARIRQEHGRGRPIKIVVFPEGTVPEETIDVMLQ